MPNEEYLVPLNKRTQSERKEIARMGAIASNKKQAEKKLLRETIEMLLTKAPTEEMIKDCSNKFGFNPKDLQEVITGGLIFRAVSGDSKAYEVLRDTIGQKPIQQVEDVTDKTPFEVKIVE